MSQSGYTPILIYASGTATNVPLAANLSNGSSGAELAINYADGKLFYKDSSGVVQTLATKGTGPIGGSNTQVQYNSSGSLAGSANLTFDGTTLTAAGVSGPHNGTVGATTPNTGSFTTLTTSSTVTVNGGTANQVQYLNGSKILTGSSNLTFDGTTLTANALTTTSTVTVNGGTANGVAYLNASKVLTTGSALTFDGTNLSGTGSMGTTIASKTAQFNAAGGSIYASFADGTNTWRIGDGIISAGQFNLYDVTNSQTTLGFVAGAAGYSAFYQNNAEQMRLTSTGLGIGTSSPSAVLHTSSGAVTNSIFATTRASGAYNQYSLGASGATIGYAGSAGQLTSGTTADFTVRAENNLTFASGGGTERARIDTSGNLGIGVTPATWSSFKALQFGDVGAIYSNNFGSGNTQTIFSNNAYFNSGYKYLQSSSAAAQYTQIGGTHAWSIAPSGTAGNAITFTQAMTLDASGNLLVGTTTARTTLTVVGSISLGATPAGGVAGTAYSVVGNSANSGNANGGDLTVVAGGGSGAGTNGNLTLRAGQTVSTGSVTTGGNLILESGKPSDGLASGYIAFNGYSGNPSVATERARIDSSGNLLVGQTANAGLARIAATFVGPANDGIDILDSANGSGSQFMAFRNSAGTAIGSITRVTTTNAVTYNTTSDYRLKEFVAPVTNAGERIDALNPVEFDWKETGSRARGFFAHEFQQVYASSVNGTKDAVDEDGNPVYQAMQASTAEVIADLVAEIKSLRVRLNALENK